MTSHDTGSATAAATTETTTTTQGDAKPTPADASLPTTDPTTKRDLSEADKAEKKKRREELQANAKKAKNDKYLKKKAAQLAAASGSITPPTTDDTTTQSGVTTKTTKPTKTPKPPKPGKIVTPIKTASATPPGQKKDLSGDMAPAYNPIPVESAWYQWWEEQGFFKPEYIMNSGESAQPKEKFIVVIPPPNVTGSLHLGHALTNSIQDTLIRWHRMCGHIALWVPGTDHAGIATQVVVEKKIARERRQTRHDLGREVFVNEVWKWKEQYGNNIKNQLRRIGSSLDWSREVFTMDPKLSRAVTEAFVRLYDEGLIYRENKLVNWCCTLKTAVSDIEVDVKELDGPTPFRVPGHPNNKTYIFGELTLFAYKVVDSEEEVVVATTRIETMLGDTAVAIHPDDPRHKHLHGKFLVHPFFATRKLPIICDSKLVDMAFGTGAVKVTPAHDANDYECGLRHNLEIINIFTDGGACNDCCGKFAGLMRFEARNAVLEDLKKLGLFRGTQPNKMRLGICSRSGDIIEPKLMPQWWMNCHDMANESINAVKTGALQMFPAQAKETWFRWLENIRDWCISRQLWWGHRIPAYLVSIKGQPAPDPTKNTAWVVARSSQEALEKAAKKFSTDPANITLAQDPDVLDTWFSSGLFPFSVFGWPDNTPDLQNFYPTTLLETGHDILFFWVARMVMLGLKLTGQLPFSQVLLHAMVRDAQGRKMSKSLGNVVDPIDVIHGITLPELHKKLQEGNLNPDEIALATAGQKKNFPKGIEECGTDAMRFAFCAYTSQGRDINLDINRVVGYRKFCNKLWNATRFALMNMGPTFVPHPVQMLPVGGSGMDQWILSRLASTVNEVAAGMRAYEFSTVTTALYSFWLYDLCDVYLEATKPIFAAGGAPAELAKETLYICFDNGLKMLHPFMPYVTEELWQRLPRRASVLSPSIMVASYPVPSNFTGEWINKKLEGDVRSVMEIVESIRTLNSPYSHQIHETHKSPAVTVVCAEEQACSIYQAYQGIISLLSFSPNLTIVSTAQNMLGCAVNILNRNCTVYSDLKGILDPQAEILKLEKIVTETNTELTKLRLKISDPLFEQRTPANVRETMKSRVVDKEKELAESLSAITMFKEMKAKITATTTPTPTPQPQPETVAPPTQQTPSDTTTNHS